MARRSPKENRQFCFIAFLAVCKRNRRECIRIPPGKWLRQIPKTFTVMRKRSSGGAMRRRDRTKRWGVRPGYGILLAILPLMLVWGCVSGGMVIRDLDELNQDPLSYPDRSAADAPFLPLPEQSRLSAEFNLLYFAPWHRTAPRHTREMASSGFRKYAAAPGYGQGGHPHPGDWVPKMAANAHIEDYAKRIFPAVTVNPT